MPNTIGGRGSKSCFLFSVRLEDANFLSTHKNLSSETKNCNYDKTAPKRDKTQ